MAKEFYIKEGLNVEKFLIDFFTINIGQYRLSELTNGHCGDIPSINNVHPLAMEYGNALNSDGDNFTSKLPAIGIELVDDNKNDRQPIGEGYEAVELTQDFIDNELDQPYSDREKSGYVISDTTIQNIKDMKAAKGSEKLYGIRKRYLQDERIGISIWSKNADVKKILYSVIKGLLKRCINELSKNYIKNLKIKGQNSLYNYEFGETYFGAEITLDYHNSFKNVEVNSDIVTIKEIEEYYNDPLGKVGPTFNTISN